jgi:hypothetical protein
MTDIRLLLDHALLTMQKLRVGNFLQKVSGLLYVPPQNHTPPFLGGQVIQPCPPFPLPIEFAGVRDT